MLLYRLGAEGFYAAGERPDDLRWLRSDPFATPPSAWELGRAVAPDAVHPLIPVTPRQVVGIGRNYREHAAELGNPMPEAPLMFAKPVSSLIGPRESILLPPESAEVQFEGEIAVVVGRRLARASAEEAAEAIFGVTAACDVTARDLQRRDKTFFRGKSFDTFGPLGPAILLGAPPAELEVVTRVNGDERQRGRVADMAWPPAELLARVSTIVTLEPGDVILTGTPAGVGRLAPGDVVEVEVSGVGVLVNPVAARETT